MGTFYELLIPPPPFPRLSRPITGIHYLSKTGLGIFRPSSARLSIHRHPPPNTGLNPLREGDRGEQVGEGEQGTSSSGRRIVIITIATDICKSLEINLAEVRYYGRPGF